MLTAWILGFDLFSFAFLATFLAVGEYYGL